MAVKKGLINNAQLRACLMKKSSDQLIGEVLIEDGLLSEKDVEELLSEQVGSPRLGDLAVKQKLITSKDVEEALRVRVLFRQVVQRTHLLRRDRQQAVDVLIHQAHPPAGVRERLWYAFRPALHQYRSKMLKNTRDRASKKTRTTRFCSSKLEA